jgi:hypothetical protein
MPIDNSNSDDAWTGPHDGLLSQMEAERIATQYGRQLRLAPFIIDFAELLNRDGEPKWFVPLFFTDLDSEFIGLPSCAYVHVHARTGVPESIQSL